MPTLSAPVNRFAPESWSLTEEFADPVGVESALIVSDADLAGWSDADAEALRRVLVILPLSGEPPYGRIETAVRRAGRGHAAGVVLATGSAGAASLDLEALAALARRDRIPLPVAPDDPSRVWVRMMTAIPETWWPWYALGGTSGRGRRSSRSAVTGPSGPRIPTPPS